MKWHLDKITIVALVALILYLDYRIVRPFLTPLAWAAAITVFTHRLHQWLLKRIDHPNLAALTSVCLVAVVIVAPAIAIGTACVREGISFFQNLSEGEILSKLRASLDWAIQSLPVSQTNVENWVKDLAGTTGSELASWSAGAARSMVEAVFHLVIMFLALFYFYRDGALILQFFKDISPFSQETTDRIVERVDNLVNATLAGNFAVALSQGFLLGLVFWILGLTAPVFWGSITGVIAFLPLLGAAPVWLVAAVLLFLQGEIGRAVAMLILGTFVISLADNFVRPIFVTRKSQLTILVVLISLLGGLLTFGFLGIVLGPLLAALTLGLLSGYQTEMKEMKHS